VSHPIPNLSQTSSSLLSRPSSPCVCTTVDPTMNGRRVRVSYPSIYPISSPSLPSSLDKDGILLQHAMAHISSLRQENQDLREKMGGRTTRGSSRLSTARSTARSTFRGGNASSRPSTAAAMSSLPSQRSSTPFLDTMRSMRILEEEKEEFSGYTSRSQSRSKSYRSTARSQKIISTRRSQKIGTEWLLERGVPRAQTPLEKVYVPPAMRQKMPAAIPLVSKDQPPGVQRMGQQRGAGEQGAMRIGRSCINFDPCGVTRDHQMSVEQSFISREAIGCPPSRQSNRGKVEQNFDGTFRRAPPKPKKKKN